MADNVLDLVAENAQLRAEVEQLRAAASQVEHLNRPMLKRLRQCAADTSPNWDGAVTVYPPDAQRLVALIDALLLVAVPGSSSDPARRVTPGHESCDLDRTCSGGPHRCLQLDEEGTR